MLSGQRMEEAEQEQASSLCSILAKYKIPTVLRAQMDQEDGIHIVSTAQNFMVVLGKRLSKREYLIHNLAEGKREM